MQITMVGREVWRGARKAQALQGAEAGDSTVQDRLRKLKQVAAFRKHKVGWSEIQSLVASVGPPTTAGSESSSTRGSKA